jgi:hypothetical protein
MLVSSAFMLVSSAFMLVSSFHAGDESDSSPTEDSSPTGETEGARMPGSILDKRG